MNEDKELPSEFTIRQPWWIRVALVIVSKDGIERLIALTFIGSVLFAGYRIIQLIEIVGSRHMHFMDVQTSLSVRNAETLETISGVSERLNHTLEDLRHEALKEHELRSHEHKMLLEEIKRK